MPFNISCPNCAVRLSAKESMIGKKVPCPKCKASVSIVAPASPSQRAPTAETNNTKTHVAGQPISTASTRATATVPVPKDAPTPATPPPLVRPTSTRSTPTILAIIGLVLLALMLVPFAGYGILALVRGSKPDTNSTQPQFFASTADSISNRTAETTPPQPSEEDRAKARAEAERIANEIAEQATQKLVEQMRIDAANRNIAAWKEMRQCDNRCERLSRESPIEYWESMREGYGAIDTQGVDDEFVTLLQSYRTLFLTYANTERDWNRERAPLVNALNNAKQPESFGEGLIKGLVGGVTIAMVEEIDTKYKNKLARLKTQLDAIQSEEVTLRQTMSERYGVQFP